DLEMLGMGSGAAPSASQRSDVGCSAWLERRGTTCLREWTLWGALVLLEKHGTECTCSYCRGFDGTFGLALPSCKARNSWRVVWWRRNGWLYDLRWTLPSWWKPL